MKSISIYEYLIPNRYSVVEIDLLLNLSLEKELINWFFDMFFDEKLDMSDYDFNKTLARNANFEDMRKLKWTYLKHLFGIWTFHIYDDEILTQFKLTWM